MWRLLVCAVLQLRVIKMPFSHFRFYLSLFFIFQADGEFREQAARRSGMKNLPTIVAEAIPAEEGMMRTSWKIVVHS